VPLVGVTWTLAVATWLVLLPLARTEARKPSLAVAMVALLMGGFGDATYARVAARPFELMLHHEDGGGIVEVYQDRNGHRRLMSSRLRQEGGDEPEQVHNELRQGRLPVALHPAPKRVLVIGMGTAISLRGALSEQVERLVCVEISRGVIRGARLFAEANGNVLEEPRVVLVEQDGRNFIKLTDERYDLIVQELFFHYRAGVGALYTVDHFRRAKTRLNPGGQFAQWISLAQIGRAQLASLVRTFTEVFPESSGWLVGGYFMLIGGEERLALTRDTPMLGHFFGARKLAEWARSASLNTEDNLSIEFSVPKAFRELNTTALTVENLRALMTAEEAIEAYDDRLPGGANAASRRVRQATLQRFDGDHAAAIGNYEQALLLDPGNFLARRAMIAEYEARNDHRALLRLDPEHVGARFNLGVELYKARQYEEASRQFEFVLRREPGNPDAVFNMANSQAQIGRYTNAVTLYERLLRLRPDHADARANLAELKRVLGQPR